MPFFEQEKQPFSLFQRQPFITSQRPNFLRLQIIRLANHQYFPNILTELLLTQVVGQGTLFLGMEQMVNNLFLIKFQVNAV